MNVPGPGQRVIQSMVVFTVIGLIFTAAALLIGGSFTVFYRGPADRHGLTGLRGDTLEGVPGAAAARLAPVPGPVSRVLGRLNPRARTGFAEPTVKLQVAGHRTVSGLGRGAERWAPAVDADLACAS